MLYILPINIVVLDEYTRSTLVHCVSCLELVYPPPLPGKTEFCHIGTEMLVERFCLNDCLRYVDQFKDAVVVHEMASDSISVVTELGLWLTESMVKSITFYDIPS